MSNPKTVNFNPSPIEERNLEYENATKEERERYLQWKMVGYIPAQNCPKLKGRIIKVAGGVQNVETDSKEEGKRIIPCLGFTWIEGGEVGDWVEMEYMVHVHKNVAMWTGRITEKGRG